MGLENLTDEERAKLFELMAKVEDVEEESRAGQVVYDNENERYTVLANPGPPAIARTLDENTWVKRQLDTMAAVGETNYREGIKRPKKSPKLAALKGHAKYKAKMRDEAVLQRQHDNRAKVPDEEWLAMCEFGASKLASGTAAREHKIRNFVGKWIPILSSHLAKIDAMEDATDAQREAKVIANIRGLKALKGKAK